jgi:hypothetical protein
MSVILSLRSILSLPNNSLRSPYQRRNGDKMLRELSMTDILKMP